MRRTIFSTSTLLLSSLYVVLHVKSRDCHFLHRSLGATRRHSHIKFPTSNSFPLYAEPNTILHVNDLNRHLFHRSLRVQRLPSHTRPSTNTSFQFLVSLKDNSTRSSVFLVSSSTVTTLHEHFPSPASQSVLSFPCVTFTFSSLKFVPVSHKSGAVVHFHSPRTVYCSRTRFHWYSGHLSSLYTR